MMKTFAIVTLSLVLCASMAEGVANPGFPRYFSIVPENTPGVQGVPTDIDVRTFNYGSDPSNGVEVSLYFNDWGAIYNGWQLIDTETINLGANGNSLDTFTHTFQAAAHTCLQARITDPGDGGNSDTGDDTIQLNWDVISADDAQEVDLYVPFGNADGEEILVNGTEIVCVNNSVIIDCPGTQGGADIMPRLNDADNNIPAPGQWNQQDVMPGNSEVLTKLSIPANYMAMAGLDELTVMVRTEMGPKDGPREQVHAMITILKTTVAEILNKPHLCCIESIKTRVMLESMLADALDAYESGEPGACKQALKLLRMFVQKAKLLECDLTDAEIKCIQKAVQTIVDAGLMIAREKGTAPNKAKYIKEAMFFRRAGLYEAALLEAAKAC